MSINIGVPEKTARLRPRVLVLGVGGGGCNALNTMIASKLKGVEFVACNTDVQSLEHCNADQKIQLGISQTQGLGAGSDPAIGKAAAEESYNDICECIDGAHMAFITSGMGGGTGTGAVSVIAKACKEKGILTVAVVTKPFNFEGAQRMVNAEKGINELREYVDTLIVIPNQNLFIVSDEKTSYAKALSMADQVLHAGVRGITDLMLLPGLINLDFADVKSVMLEMGRAVIGNGEAEGERRAVEAAEDAISNPLLDHVSLQGAKGLLMNISGGSDMTLIEVEEAAEKVKAEAGPAARIIYGSSINKDLDGKMRVSIVATGIENIVDIKTKKEEKIKNKNNSSDSLPEQTDLEDFTDPVVEVERNNEFTNSNDKIINTIQENQIKPSNVVLNFIKKYSPLKIFNRTKKEEKIEKPGLTLSETIPQQKEFNDKENKYEKKENEEVMNQETINQTKEESKINIEKKHEIKNEDEKNSVKRTEQKIEEDKGIEKKETPIEIQPEIQGLEGNENNTKDDTKELENTKDSNNEEDLTIPSFLRNQSN